MKFFSVADNTAPDVDPVVIQAMRLEDCQDTFAREWLGMESWQEALGDGVDAEHFSFTEQNHGPATEFPGQVYIKTPKGNDKFSVMRGDPNFAHLSDAELRAVVNGPVSGVIAALDSGPMNAPKKPPALKTFPKPPAKKRHR